MECSLLSLLKFQLPCRAYKYVAYKVGGGTSKLLLRLQRVVREDKQFKWSECRLKVSCEYRPNILVVIS